MVDKSAFFGKKVQMN